MALVQRTGKLARTCNTFGEYGSKLFEVILSNSKSVLRIDIVGIDISKAQSRQVSNPVEVRLVELQLTSMANRH